MAEIPDRLAAHNNVIGQALKSTRATLAKGPGRRGTSMATGNAFSNISKSVAATRAKRVQKYIQTLSEVPVFQELDQDQMRAVAQYFHEVSHVVVIILSYYLCAVTRAVVRRPSRRGWCVCVCVCLCVCGARRVVRARGERRRPAKRWRRRRRRRRRRRPRDTRREKTTTTVEKHDERCVCVTVCARARAAWVTEALFVVFACSVWVAAAARLS